MTDRDLDRVGLAEIIGALSLGIDLGFNQPMEHVLRQCFIALRLADELDLDAEARSVVYYTALLTNVACHTDAHEQAKWFGDDIAMKSDKYAFDGLHGVRPALAGFRRLGSGQPLLRRFRLGLEFALGGYREVAAMIDNHAEMARTLAADIGLPTPVQDAVGAAYEQWDGKGWPGERKGEDVPIAARVSEFAEFIEVAYRTKGVDGARALARKLSGNQVDPTVAACFEDNADAIVRDLSQESTWHDVIVAEPSLAKPLSAVDLDKALRAIADHVDLKSPYFVGHARGVGELVRDAGVTLGLDTDARTLVYRAALVQGLGRLGVSNAILDKNGALGTGERERVRLQPYLTERILRQSDALAPIGALAAQVRERLDGSGYPRGLRGDALGMPARVLAAADVYQAMIEPRPYRDARAADEAAAELRREVRAGRFDGDAVEAVLVAAGHRRQARPERPAGLTEREVDVLRLLSLGKSSKEIAAALVISPKTARNHIEHIYVKTGATSRVNASMFALRNGLLSEGAA